MTRDDLVTLAQSVMAMHNKPITPTDPPYPASLRPIAEAVVDALTEALGVEQ